MGGDDPRKPGDGRDEQLDEALEESFPASDPPAGNGSVMPPAPLRPKPDDKEG